MTAELRALLDGLDAAREKATPGEWELDLHAFGDGHVVMARGLRRAHLPHSDLVTDDADNAALIVAAVNSLPKLTAALRAVLALIDPEAEMATGNGYDATRLFSEQQITAALTPEQADR